MNICYGQREILRTDVFREIFVGLGVADIVVITVLLLAGTVFAAGTILKIVRLIA